jgi:hypothetical protein
LYQNRDDDDTLPQIDADYPGRDTIFEPNVADRHPKSTLSTIDILIKF